MHRNFGRNMTETYRGSDYFKFDRDSLAATFGVEGTKTV